MGRNEMRAGDADGQQVAARLRQALDEGRLDLHEYDERLQRAYAAKTFGDLSGLLDDLPPAPLAGPAAAPDLYHHATRRWLWQQWEHYLGVVGLVVGIWAIICLSAQELIYFWPIWVAGPWGLVLLGQTVSGLSRGEPRKWVEREEHKRQEEIDKEERKAALEAERPAQRPGLPGEPAAQAQVLPADLLGPAADRERQPRGGDAEAV